MSRSTGLILGLSAVVLAGAFLLVRLFMSFDAGPGEAPDREYVGSESCAACHQEIYDRWRETLMANVVADPAERPEAVLGDFSRQDPLVDFTLEDVALTYGSRWKQVYFTRAGDDYALLPAQWDVTSGVWRPFPAEPDGEWWSEHYGGDPALWPPGPLCQGCHATNYDVETSSATEWNVGCEKCHGGGSAHVEAPGRRNIVNPSRLDFVRGVDVCVQCHSQGRSSANPIDGEYYDWPVGYEPGERLSDYWTLEERRLGDQTRAHWPEGSARVHEMQGNDFVQSEMYTEGVGCWGCHDVHGTDHAADLIAREDTNETCLACHGPGSPDGPSGALAEHTRHEPEGEGSLCVGCHMPRTARMIADVSVRSHTFRFVTPDMTADYGIPNGCTSCHADQTLDWAREALLGWENFSPWRLGE